ncbi:hypothetical protein [Youxingia wuxianensis]|uniref:Uncharacterized protein n=1 Tax=Youxingia wuxianensis TaxID=2763678 RepID=A0A926IHW8_9FIRM|nr:hypothetical protein [Youxingia wuxianensis]MBC8586364.1 hypothetical protein [Youxingia wuxianensis]
MLKGVSQKVIEVVNTDNKYFEKAILFLRPQPMGEENGHTIKKYASEYLSQITYQPTPKNKKSLMISLGKIILSAGFGAAVTCAFFLL